MNTKIAEKNWVELKGKIKSKWSKLNDEELEGFKSNLGQLAEKIKNAYGISIDHADRQYEEFKKSVQSLIGDAGAEVPTANPTVTPIEALPKPNLAATPQVIKPIEPLSAKDSKVS